MMQPTPRDEARDRPRVGVVGSGVSGLAAADALLERGFNVELVEASREVGGRTGSALLGDRRIDVGGKNIGRKYPLFREFVARYGGARWEPFGINTSQMTGSRLLHIRSDAKWRTLLNVLKCVGPIDFGKLMLLSRTVQQNPDNGFLDGPDFQAISERFDSRPVTAYCSRRCASRFIRPIVVRMNGAEPDEYYTGNLGSNLKMVMDTYEQLATGMHEVLSAVTRRVPTLFGAVAKELLTSEGRVVGLRVERGGVLETREYAGGVVVATDALSCATLLRSALPRTAELLDLMVYNPVAVALVEYERPVFTPETRAMVFDPSQVISNAGAHGRRDLNIVRYTFSGRSARQLIATEDRADVLVTKAEQCLRQRSPFTLSTKRNQVYRYFPRGLCAYAPFHHRTMEAIRRDLRSLRGIGLAGDYVRGASIEACFRSGTEAANVVAAPTQSSPGVPASWGEY